MKKLSVKIREIIYALVVLSSLLFYSSCKDNEVELIGGYDDGTITYPPTTKILSKTEWSNNFISFSDDSLTLIFNDEILKSANLKVNDILVSGYGDGILRRVNSIKNIDNKVEIKTTQAAMTDAFENLSMSASIPSSNMTVERIEIFEEGIKTGARTTETDLQQLLELDILIVEDQNNSINIEGAIENNFDLNVNINIKDYKLKYFETKFTVNSKAELQLLANLTKSLDWSRRIVNVHYAPIIVQAGPVPVVLRPNLFIKIGADLSGSIEYSFGATLEKEYEVGIKFENEKLSEFKRLTEEYTVIEPSIESSVEAKTYIEPFISLKLYGLVGPFLSKEVYLKVIANPSSNPWLEVLSGLNLKIGVEMYILNGRINLNESYILYEIENSIYALQNHPPSTPKNSLPLNNSTNQPLNITFKWNKSVDPEFSIINYDIHMDKSNSPSTIIASDIRDTVYTYMNLDPGSKYYWKVLAKDNAGNVVEGQIWNFTTSLNSGAKGLVALFPFNGNSKDESGFQNHGIIVGGVTPTQDRFGNSNKAMQFNGVDGYIEVANSASLQSPTDALTIAGWLYIDDFSGGHVVGLVNKTKTSQYGQYGIDYHIWGSPNRLYFNYSQGKSGHIGIVDLELAKWHFIATTYDGARAKIYVNGNLITDEPSSISSIMPDNNPVTLGLDTPGDTEFLRGRLDDICIYNIALSENEVVNLYRERGWSYDHMPVDGILAYYKFLGSANDYSGNNHHGIAYNIKSASDRFDQNGSAFSFNGVDSKIVVPNFHPNMNNFSVSVWFTLPEYDVSNNTRWLLGDAGGYKGFNIMQQYNNLSFQVAWGGGGTCCINEVAYQLKPIDENQWHHAVIGNKNGTMYAYLNGQLLGTAPTHNSIDPSYYNFAVGHDEFQWFNGYWKGLIDDVVFFDRMITPEEVELLHLRTR